jgi:hypothetical protein
MVYQALPELRPVLTNQAPARQNMLPLLQGLKQKQS